MNFHPQNLNTFLRWKHFNAWNRASPFTKAFDLLFSEWNCFRIIASFELFGLPIDDFVEDGFH